MKSLGHYTVPNSVQELKAHQLLRIPGRSNILAVCHLHLKSKADARCSVFSADVVDRTNYNRRLLVRSRPSDGKEAMKHSAYPLIGLVLLLAATQDTSAAHLESILAQENGNPFALYTPSSGNVEFRNLDSFSGNGFTSLQINSAEGNLVPSNSQGLSQQTSWSGDEYSLTWFWSSGIGHGTFASTVDGGEIVLQGTPVTDLTMSISRLFTGGFSTLRGFDFRVSPPITHSANVHLVPEPSSVALCIGFSVVLLLNARSRRSVGSRRFGYCLGAS